MKAVIATILLASALSASFLAQSRMMSAEELQGLPFSAESLRPVFQAMKTDLQSRHPNGQYDKCFDLTEKAAKNFVNAIRFFINKDYDAAGHCYYIMTMRF